MLNWAPGVAVGPFHTVWYPTTDARMAFLTRELDSDGRYGHSEAQEVYTHAQEAGTKGLDSATEAWEVRMDGRESGTKAWDLDHQAWEA